MWYHPLGGREHWIKLSLAILSFWSVGWVIRDVGRQLEFIWKGRGQGWMSLSELLTQGNNTCKSQEDT